MGTGTTCPKENLFTIRGTLDAMFIKIILIVITEEILEKKGSLLNREECPCQDLGALISRNHFLTCRAIDPSLFDSLPRSPPPPMSIVSIMHCPAFQPTQRKAPPDFWSALLTILWLIDTLCLPSKNIPEDPLPGSSWFPPTQVEQSE